VTDVGGTMDYERAGVAETYRRFRTLPAETFSLWRALLRELLPTCGITRVPISAAAPAVSSAA
jgi:hypothetical protein